ncbi:hypothetical protein PANO111632_17800 [Paracoccus nototheniae]|uniref:hypothetical protein n=1 Tax=Paracoccus nototheniae TaxID=2489002 RepID=UPI001038C282|nr:hypothetical protein [Paracoccus nototheniae]
MIQRIRRAGGRLAIGRLAIGLALWSCAATGAIACSGVPRTTLALYDSTREGAPRDTRIHRYAELVLNHLGQRVVYHDLSQGGAPAADPGDVRLVLSWLDDGTAANAPGLEGLGAWLSRHADFCEGSPRIVAMGNLSPWTGLPPEAAQRAFAAMGVLADGSTHAVGVQAVQSLRDAALMDHEAVFMIAPGNHAGVTAAADARSLLQLTSGGRAIDLAVTGPAGGYLHDSAAIAMGAQGQAAWIVDPFGFFGQVLDQDGVPRPDPTTRQGLRSFFATVTAEGWLDVMPTRSFGEPERLASEELVSRLIDPFADLPLSVAVLAGDLVPGLGGPLSERGLQAARQAFAAPHVQGAVQGFSDIRDWSFFAAYDPGREAALLDAPQVVADRGALVTSAVMTLRDAFAETGASTFSRTPGAPRKYAAEAFDLGAELGGAIAQVNALTPEDRPAQLYNWSGNARPYEAALAAEAATGLVAMGGGGGVMDAAHPSLTGLMPLSVQVGEQRQVYDALGGDAAYTGSWTAPLYGFHGFGQTLARTEEPRRLRPFHLSFAARSAIHFETRRAVETYLDMARTAPVVPIRAADHGRAVLGFDSMRITPEGPDLWRVTDRGGLDTLRLDKAADRMMDIARSQGVMGARRKGDALYIALDPAAPEALVAVVAGDDPSGVLTTLPAPVLQASRLIIERWNRSDCAVEMELSGFAAGDVTLTGPPDARYGVAISGVDEGQRHPVTADGSGLLVITVPAAPGGLIGLSVQGECLG